ncbi:hypothetical protein XFLM_02520 [Xylella fastidiosa subsp. fastidiosa GB514]|nr:hypothetical protein XFLM_02520 [Xylella fastidiosa subsp. fastidiosa GB514]KAF0571133.1 hypothetical protein P305_06405 [Xylella fastidiosa subsp. fastidiosa Mus-1]
MIAEDVFFREYEASCKMIGYSFQTIRATEVQVAQGFY